MTAAGLCLAAAGCGPETPPTITPGVPVGTSTGATVIEIPLGTSPPGTPAATPQPVVLGKLERYRDPEGFFTLDVPEGWVATRQPAASGTDIRMGVVFQPIMGSGLATVTQFDNGEVPDSLGLAINAVLDLTEWTKQPGYRELGRENVPGLERQAQRVEISYQRRNGVRMHSLALFRIDGTTFSMINVAVEENSWPENEHSIRDLLASYRLGVD